MTDTLYIIGNGFDLHHGLRTSYSNFRDNKEKKGTLWNDLLDIYGDSPLNEYWWRDFENMLGRIDYSNLINTRNGEALGFMKVKNLMKGKLPPLFGSWIKGVEKQIDTERIKLMEEIESDSLFFTFNYTLLLEKVYHVDDERVWHIHESIKHVDHIVVGHDADGGQLVKYTQEYYKGHMNISPAYVNQINQEALNGAKKVTNRISLLEDKFYQYCDIKHFIAMGFSFNNIDMPYIEKIWSVNKDKEKADWTVYWFSKGEDIWIKEELIRLGVSPSKINTIKW